METEGISRDLQSKLRILEIENCALKQQLDYLTRIVELLPGNVYWKDMSGYYQGCNRNLANILKLNSPRDIVGKTAFDLTTVENAFTIEKIDQSVLEKDTEFVLEESGYDEKGEEAWYLTRKVPLRDDHGNVMGIAGISLDVTEHKRSKQSEEAALLQAQQANYRAAVETEFRETVHILAGSIVHDLRTPLATLNIHAPILGSLVSKLLRAYTHQKSGLSTSEEDLGFSEEQIPLIDNILEKNALVVEQMKHFIDVTLKSMSKGVLGKIDRADLQPCSIQKCLKKALYSFPFQSEKKQFVHQECAGDFSFLGDEILMMRILINLIKNALEQISLKGQGELFFAIEQQGKENIFCIKDTAGGVTQTHIDTLFTPYQSQKTHGTGIGLSFCKVAMRAMGGDIHARLVEGDCVEFRLVFERVMLQ